MNIFKSKKDTIYPGAQQKKYKVSGLLSSLYFLTLSSFLCLIYAIIQENPEYIGPELKKYTYFKILDIKSAASIFVSLMGLIIVRRHFILGLSPKIIYEATRVTESSIIKDPTSNIWSVKILNVGLGAGVFDKVEYSVKIASKEEKRNIPFEELIKYMKENGLNYNSNYKVINITQGYTIPAKETKVIFEIEVDKTSSLIYLDIDFSFSGFLGESYRKTVYCIPRQGIKDVSKIIIN